MISDLAQFALAAMLHFAPPSAQDKNPWAETAEQGLARYTEIATTIGDACADSKAPRSCVALLVAIGWGESGFARDADLGPCHREGAWKTRCDSGLAASVWQARAYGRDKAGEQITVPRLFAERSLAAWVVLRVARGSLRQCRHLPEEQRLAGLGNGWCKPSKAATARWHMWKRVEAFRPLAPPDQHR